MYFFSLMYSFGRQTTYLLDDPKPLRGLVLTLQAWSDHVNIHRYDIYIMLLLLHLLLIMNDTSG